MKNKSENKTILFHSFHISTLSNLILVAKSLQDNFHILFIIPDKSYLTQLNNHKFEVICLHCPQSQNNIKPCLSQRLIYSKHISKLLNWIKPSSIGQIIWQQLFYNQYKYYYRAIKPFFIDKNIKLLITLNDGKYLPIENVLLKLSKEFNIKILIPYIMNNNADVFYLLNKNNEKYQLKNNSSLFQKVIFRKYAYQAFKDHYFLPAFLYFALQRFGTLSKMPWLNGGGLSDIVIVANKDIMLRHTAMGINKNKLLIASDISYIPLFDSYINKKQLKQQFISKYKLPHLKIIIINLTNWWEHNLADKETHWEIAFKTIESVLEYKDKYSILISLHPSMQFENYHFLEKKYPIKILKDRLMESLAIADIYVADYSSTVNWSIICGIKTIIVDFHTRLDIYEQYNSIRYAKTKKELINKIKFLIENEISFDHDWDLLSRDKVFHEHIIKDYINIVNSLT